MSYPIFFNAILERAKKKALAKPFANKMLRKVGLRAGGSGAPRTVIDAYLKGTETALSRQYVTDLSGATEVSLYGRSDNTTYVYYSTDLSSVTDPGDWEHVSPGLFATQADYAGWQPLSEGARGPVRLTVSTFDSGIRMLRMDHGFSLSMRVR